MDANFSHWNKNERIEEDTKKTHNNSKFCKITLSVAMADSCNEIEER